MSFSEEELNLHCETILTQRKILNKIIILCEGVIPKEQGTLSPQSYSQMERLPDANFYKNCIPSSWRESLPVFFNCGDRYDVLSTYFSLLEMIKEDINNNLYFHPRDIFAIVDLDLQNQTISNYHFADIHLIHGSLYEKAKINEANFNQHQIWVTGLIHKEAYFLVPELQLLFDKHPIKPLSQDNNLLLESIYLLMCNDLTNDEDLKNNFEVACSRINHCIGLDFNTIDKLRDSWEAQFKSFQDSERKQELVFGLLTIRKAKDYWNQIEPSEKFSDGSKFRDQLSLAIAKEFYAKHTEDSVAIKYHIPYFLKMLRQSI